MDILIKQNSDAINEYGPDGENPHCWTGLIPVRTVAETPIADSATDPDLDWPGYLARSRFKTEF